MEKTIMGYTANELRENRVVFRCQTESFARSLLLELSQMGLEVRDSLIEMWSRYAGRTCYSVNGNSQVLLGNFEMYQTTGYEVLCWKEGSLYKPWHMKENIIYKTISGEHIIPTGTKLKYDGKDILYRVGDRWDVLNSSLNFRDVKILDVVKVEWEPLIGDLFYHPSVDTETGYIENVWDGSESNWTVENRVGVYPTAELAIKKSKELGWL